MIEACNVRGKKKKTKIITFDEDVVFKFFKTERIEDIN
jgi:hypothetical protein